MCGILYAKRKDGVGVQKVIAKRYKKQKSRGSQGFGYLTIENGKIGSIERAKTESEILDKLKKETADTILFHHRLPTSTDNHLDSTHPIVVSNKMLKHDYYVIHNGVLRDEIDLKEKHEKMGFDYRTEVEEITITRTKTEESRRIVYSFNDSEALAIDLALFLEGKQEEIESKGTIAFVCVQTTKRGEVKKIFYGRNGGNPIMLERNKNLFIIKSEGGGYELEAHKLIAIDYKTGKVEQKDVTIGSYYIGYDTSRSWGYPTEKDEISEGVDVTTMTMDEYHEYMREEYGYTDEEIRTIQLEESDYTEKVNDLAFTPKNISVETLHELFEEKTNLECDLEFYSDMIDKYSDEKELNEAIDARTQTKDRLEKVKDAIDFVQDFLVDKGEITAEELSYIG